MRQVSTNAKGIRLNVVFDSRLCEVYGDPADSQATLMDGYTVVNASVGFRQKNGPWEAVLWARNLMDREYIQNMTIQAGNSGLVVGTPGGELFGGAAPVR